MFGDWNMFDILKLPNRNLKTLSFSIEVLKFLVKLKLPIHIIFNRTDPILFVKTL